MTAYSDRVLADTPAAYWQLNETSGTVADDAGPNSIDGTIVGSPTLGVAGVSGTSFDFAPAGARVEVPDNAALKPSEVSTEVWCHGVPSTSGTNYWVNKLRTSAALAYSIRQNLGNVQGLMSNGSTLNIVSVDIATYFNAGVWNHVVATVADVAGTLTQRVYVNGVERGSGSQAGPLSHGAFGLTIGAYDSVGTLECEENLDEVAVYGYVLSAATIQEHYNLGIGAPLPAYTAFGVPIGL